MRGLSDSGKLFGRPGGDGGRPVVARGRWARRGAGLSSPYLVLRLYSLQVSSTSAISSSPRRTSSAKRSCRRSAASSAIARGRCSSTPSPRARWPSIPSIAPSTSTARSMPRSPAVPDGRGPAEEMAATIAQERSRSYLPVVVKRRVDSVAVATIEEHRDELPGVSIRVEPLRRYVHGSLAAHLLGYVGEITEIEIQESAVAAKAGPAPGDVPSKRTYQLGDVVGRAGIEQTFEARLGGRNGVRMVEVNALGRRVEASRRSPSFRREAPGPGGGSHPHPRPRAAARAGDGAPDSLTGAAVAIDARTGGILAAVSRPSFDPTTSQWASRAPPGVACIPIRAIRSSTESCAQPVRRYRCSSADGPAGLTRRAVGPWDVSRAVSAAISSVAVSSAAIMCTGG